MNLHAQLVILYTKKTSTLFLIWVLRTMSQQQSLPTFLIHEHLRGHRDSDWLLLIVWKANLRLLCQRHSYSLNVRRKEAFGPWRPRRGGSAAPRCESVKVNVQQRIPGGKRRLLCFQTAQKLKLHRGCGFMVLSGSHTKNTSLQKIILKIQKQINNIDKSGELKTWTS